MITVAIPFWSGDKDQAIRLAQWIAELGNVSEFDCLLVVDKTTNPDGVIEPLTTVFKSVNIFVPHEKVARNPASSQPEAPPANAMFRCTAWYFFYTVKTPFLWLEPDAIPLEPDWLKQIQKEYDKLGRPFMGSRVKPKGVEYMPGVAVYPEAVCEYSSLALLSRDTPWDLNAASEILKHAAWTPLIQHIYNPNFSFTDPDSLTNISPDAVLFHRDKSGELINRLRERSCQIENLKTGSKSKAAINEVEKQPTSVQTPTVVSTTTQSVKPSKLSKEELKNKRQEQARKMREAKAAKKNGTINISTPPNRIGKFKVNGQFIRNWTGILEFMRSFVVVRVDWRHDDIAEYTAYSHLFHDLKEGQIIPWYTFDIKDKKGNLEIKSIYQGNEQGNI